MPSRLRYPISSGGHGVFSGPITNRALSMNPCFLAICDHVYVSAEAQASAMLRASKPATTPFVVSPFATGGTVRPHVYGSGQVGSRRSVACPSGNCATVLHTVRIPGRVAPEQRRFARYLSEKLHGCPCGYYGDPEHGCTCSPMLISRYQRRLSGPLLDRTPAPAAQARRGDLRRL